jgi:hypothetical protein
MPNSSSKHFDLSELIDYVRQTGAPDRRAEMRRHIEGEGCERCRRNAEMLAESYGAARVLAQVDVPSAVVERARQIFQLKPAPAAAPWWKRLPAAVAELTFDGSLTPAPAGLRAVSVQPQRIYTEGSLEVRLLVDTDSAGVSTLVGAVGDRADAGRPYADLPILLVSGDKVLVQARTSRFGEFHLELPNRRDLSLAILLDGETRRVDIAIQK